ncbi:MAG: hypothetical protein AB7K24_32910 [Gemmataceae bacterium]
MIRWHRTAPVLLLLLLLGCSGNSNHQLSGKVQYAGQPVPAGEILFMPDPEKGNSGPGVLAIIKDGTYTLPEGKGHVGGAYIARITAFDGVPPPASPDEEPADQRGKVLISDHVVKLELPAQTTTHDFDVPAAP